MNQHCTLGILSTVNGFRSGKKQMLRVDTDNGKSASWRPGPGIIYSGRSIRDRSFYSRRDFWNLSPRELKGSPESGGVPRMDPILAPGYQPWWDAKKRAERSGHHGLCVKGPTWRSNRAGHHVTWVSQESGSLSVPRMPWERVIHGTQATHEAYPLPA